MVSAKTTASWDERMGAMNREEVLQLDAAQLSRKALTLYELMKGNVSIYACAGWNPVADIVVAWELWQTALASDYFWDFCNAIKWLAGNKVDFTVIMGHISPLLITRAFVLMGEEIIENGD